MYKPFLYCFLLYLLGSSIDAQNLVPNPSFEDTVYCPAGTNNPQAVKHWFNPTQASPDYYNACANNGGGVPANDWGYQYAQEGNAYVGLILYSNYIDYPNYREYIAIQLNEALYPGIDYCWSVYVSLLDSNDFASNNIGIGLSIDSITNFATESLLSIPIYGNHTSIVTDNLGWTKIGGSFVAQGGEKYLYIGNFYDDAQTNVVQIQSNSIGGSFAYYYIDNFYIGTSSCIQSSIIIPNIFTPNNDGENDVFFTQDIGVRDKTIFIYNRWGNKVFESTETITAWDGTQRGKECAEGIYFYTIDFFNVELQKTEQKKGYIHLLR